METIDRRCFMKTVVIGGAILTLEAAGMTPYLSAAPKNLKAIGECKKVTIKSISEVGWWDNEVFKRDAITGGGNQWTTAWNPKNAAGSCSLIEVEGLDGSKTRFLIDTGWNIDYMDKRFKAEGVDKMLKNGEIDFLYISHEHLDHLWGLQTTLQYNPEIKILIADTFHPPGIKFINAADFPKAGAKNTIKHKGELTKLKIGKMTKLMDGVVSVGFDIPIVLKIRGEQSLYFNVKDKGLVLCTGCCDQNVIKFSKYAVDKLGAKGNIYGLYGGLHLAPLGKLGWEQSRWIDKMASFGFKKIAPNHCTGLPAVKKMIKLGYPVVRGTGSAGSKSDLYIGNGDTVVFG